MTTMIDGAAPPQVRPFGKLKNGGKPPGTKTLTLFLPLPLHYHVQAQAALSQMAIQEYVGRFLEEAFPLPPPSRSST
jgi:hypothetical protein